MPSGPARWAIRALLVLGPAIFVAAFVAPWAAGAQVREVSGRSMEPTLSNGDTIVAFEVDPAELAVGDVIRFPRRDGGPGFYVHRIVAIEEGEPRLLRTAGDGNITLDQWVLPADKVLGRVDESYLRFSGAIGFMRSPWGLIALGVLPFALFLATFRPPRSLVNREPELAGARYVPPDGRSGTPGA
jgi:signal peptidase I